MLLSLGRGLAPAGSGQDVDQPSTPEPFTGLLDGLEAAPLAAYSTRRLSGAYTGPCLRLRRASDDAEQDFGFDAAGALDIAAATAWLSGAAGHVAAWYDQSGAAADLGQASPGRQPRIEAAAIAGLPALRFVKAEENFLERPAFPELNQADPPWSSFFVHRHAVVANTVPECVWCQGESDAELAFLAVYPRFGSQDWAVVQFRPRSAESQKQAQEAIPASFNATDAFFSSIICQGVAITWRKNQIEISGINDAPLNGIQALISNRFTLGSFNRTVDSVDHFLDGYIVEFIIFDSSLSNDDRNTIEGNQIEKWET